MNKIISVIAIAGICLVGCQQRESVVRLDNYRLLNTISATSFANGFFRDLKAADGRTLKVEDYVSKAARRTGRDIGFTAQLNSHKGDGDYFTSLNQLRFQMYHAMAFGATTLGWACYSDEWWENNALTRDGKRTDQYDKAKIVNAEI